VRAWLLGSGGWFPTTQRETTSVLVREGAEGVLLDAGTGARRLATDHELVEGLTSLDVVLTHFHLDHVCGLLYLQALSGLERAPRVWAPGRWLYDAPSEEVLDAVLRQPISPSPVPIVSEVLELRAGEQVVGPLEIEALAQLRHWGPTAGLRVGDALALVTDTAREAGHAEFTRGVRHLLHEAWSTSSKPIYADCDATAYEAGGTAAAAGAGRLTLVHLNPQLRSLEPVLADAREAFEAAELGEDGAMLA
jgi:ribonuclease BN (tRNA processing enzyme)